LLGELDGARDRSSVLRKSFRHLGRGEQHAFVVATAIGLAAVERAAVTDRDENVLQPCAPGLVRVNVAGDDRVDAERTGEVAQQDVAVGVAALVRSLELDEETLATESPGEAGGGVRIADGEAVTRAAGKADQAVVQL